MTTIKPATITTRSTTTFSGFWIAGGAAVIAAAWFCGPLIARAYSRQFSGTGLADMGTTGDSFGVMTSLFSGIGFVGIALVLWFDLRQRSESRAPVLTPVVNRNLADDAVNLLEESASVSFRSGVKILSPEPAINVAGAAWIHLGDELFASKELNVPHAIAAGVPSGDEQSSRFEVAFELSGSNSLKLRQLISQPVGAMVSIQLTYSSVSGVRWATFMTYQLREQIQSPQDHGLTTHAKPQREDHVSDLPAAATGDFAVDSDLADQLDGASHSVSSHTRQVTKWQIVAQHSSWRHGLLKN